MESLDKEKTYFVYCLSGKRSGDAVNLMAEAGFENIYTLKDGLQKWTEEGLETTKP
jgi:rhodanese-related sulfurtransferase